MTSDMLVSRIQNLANDTYNVSRIHQVRELHESVRSFSWWPISGLWN